MEKLPKKWNIKVTKENVDDLGHWRDSGGLTNTEGYLLSNYHDHKGYWVVVINAIPPEYKQEISFEDFKIHILKEAPPAPFIVNDYQLF